MAKKLSFLVDESGDHGGKARYYFLTFVFHDQANGTSEVQASSGQATVGLLPTRLQIPRGVALRES